jgi:hypothetical protein
MRTRWSRAISISGWRRRRIAAPAIEIHDLMVRSGAKRRVSNHGRHSFETRLSALLRMRAEEKSRYFTSLNF